MTPYVVLLTLCVWGAAATAHAQCYLVRKWGAQKRGHGGALVNLCLVFEQQGLQKQQR